VIVGDDPSRTDIEPLGAGDGWVASRHTAGGGARVVSLVVARGAVEVRAHLVAGADPGTPVRVTGWPEDDGVHAELLSAHNLLDSAGVTGPGATLFVALARLTGEPDPLPLTEAVSVEVEGEYEVRVSWPSGPSTCFRFRASDGRPSASSWSVKPR
jgi:hypothetical protein